MPRGARPASRFDGAAGQSFGAFLATGVELELIGEANDYVGKGMGGGRIVIRPPADDATAGTGSGRGSSTVLAGNTCLYGATGGELFVAGAVGERFAVRNSGAVAVVEAVGDHCCEYMTGGTVVVLGRIGYNLGAGMTGGQAFVWDPEVERVLTRVNADLVDGAAARARGPRGAALARRAPRRAHRLARAPRSSSPTGTPAPTTSGTSSPAPGPRPSSRPPPAASPPPDPPPPPSTARWLISRRGPDPTRRATEPAAGRGEGTGAERLPG